MSHSERAMEAYQNEAGKVVDKYGCIWAGPQELEGQLFEDEPEFFAAECPVFRLNQNDDEKLMSLYSQGNKRKHLPGIENITFAAIPCFEFKKRVSYEYEMVRKHPGETEGESMNRYLKTVLKRGSLFYRASSRVDPVSNYDLDYYDCRTLGEENYCRTLSEMLQTKDIGEFPGGFRVYPELNCLGIRLPRNFRSLDHFHHDPRDARLEPGDHSQYLTDVRAMNISLQRTGYLQDYHNSEIDLLTEPARATRYALIDAQFRNHLSVPVPEFYWEMPPVVTYVASDFLSGDPYNNLSWKIMVTERVLLFAVEWIRQIYGRFRIFRVSSWMFRALTQLKVQLKVVLGNQRNVEDLFFLLEEAKQGCPSWFGLSKASSRGICMRDQSRAFLGFNPWKSGGRGWITRVKTINTVLEAEHRGSYMDFPESKTWGDGTEYFCYVNILAGEIPPWDSEGNKSENAPEVSDIIVGSGYFNKTDDSNSVENPDIQNPSTEPDRKKRRVEDDKVVAQRTDSSFPHLSFSALQPKLSYVVVIRSFGILIYPRTHAKMEEFPMLWKQFGDVQMVKLISKIRPDGTRGISSYPIPKDFDERNIDI